MKITKSHLKQIIKEEIASTMEEGFLDDYVVKPMRNMKRQITGGSSSASELEQWASRAASLLDDLESSGYKDETTAREAYKFAVKAERRARVGQDGLLDSPELTAALQHFGKPTDPRGMNPDPGSRQRATDALRAALQDVAARAQEYLDGGGA